MKKTSVKATVFGVLAVLVLVASLGIAQPAYASSGFCSNGSVSASYDGSSLSVSWRGTTQVTGAWLLVPNRIAGKNNSLGNAYFFIPVLGAGTRSNPGPNTISHSGAASTAALGTGHFTHSYVIVRTTLGFCKASVNNFDIAKP